MTARRAVFWGLLALVTIAYLAVVFPYAGRAR